jgi:hypothetical protein
MTIVLLCKVRLSSPVEYIENSLFVDDNADIKAMSFIFSREYCSAIILLNYIMACTELFFT